MAHMMYLYIFFQMYQVLPFLAESKGFEKPVVVVVSPLNIIQNEQIDILKGHGIRACRLSYCDSDFGTSELVEEDRIDNVINGDFPIVFAHPEALLNTSAGKMLLRDSMFQERVVAVAIDECHIVEEW